MDKDLLNMQIRKFLKKVGVTSQRTIEEAINQALDNNKIAHWAIAYKATMTLRIEDLDVSMQIEESIRIE